MIDQGLLFAGMKRKHLGSILLPLLALILISSCSSPGGNNLDQQVQFTLEIGRMEDDIDLVEKYGEAYTRKTRLVMKDGLFFISNGNAGKIMEFNSYGDIISLYYNPRENPAPVLLKEPGAGDQLSNRRAFPWPFRRIGEIGVGEDDILLVEEEAQDYQLSFDEELGVSLNSVVLRFTPDGEILDYLGQEGVGGTPFPYIEELLALDDGRAAVVSRAVDRWLYYLFDSNGMVLSNPSFQPETIPVPEGERNFKLPSIKKIIPGHTGELVHVVADFYREDGEGAINFDHTAVSVYDVNQQQWRGRIPLPEKIIGRETGGIVENRGYRSIYEPLGISEGGHLFFLAPEEGERFELMIMTRDGTVVSRKNIILKDDEISYRDFYLSRKGILCALLAYEFEVDIVWWRSDTLLEE